MKIEHDFHIHTGLSSCAKDKENATLEKYLENAREYGLKKLGFADHLWDSAIKGAPRWYQPQNVDHVLPLKEKLRAAKANGLLDEENKIQMYFGCEAEYDYAHRDVALTEAAAEQFDFVIVPNSHTHIVMPKDYYEPHQRHADFMLQAYEDIINSKVSRYITAMAHPFQAVCCPYPYGELIDLISDDQFKRLFDQTAEKGIAFEINMAGVSRRTDEEIEKLPQIRLFRLAKECGCKFIFGSDSHDIQPHRLYHRAEFVAHLLELKESDLAEIAR